MAKEEAIEVKGIIIETLPNSSFRVKLEDNDHILIAYTSGRMKKNRIRILLGDHVVVAMTSYDLNRGRIVKRTKSITPTSS